MATTRQIEIALELFRKGGIVKSSEWVTGSGKHTKKRALPIYSKEYERPLVEMSHLPKHVQEFFKANPKVKKCIAIDEDLLELQKAWAKND